MRISVAFSCAFDLAALAVCLQGALLWQEKINQVSLAVLM